MADEKEKTSPPKEGAEEKGDDEGDQDRPTVAPPFDPVAFAKEVLGARPSPAGGMAAALKIPTAPPPKITPVGTAAVRPMIPTLSDPAELADSEGLAAPPSNKPNSALSLVNQRVPSNIPPKPRQTPPPRKESAASFAAIDREWEELATSPPPPMQQALIDASMRDGPSSKELPPSTKQANELVERIAEDEKHASSPPAETPAAPPPEPKVDDDDGPVIEVVPSEQEMTDRVSLGDYTGALDIAEKLLLLEPDNEAAEQTAESCRGILRQMYTARIGPLDKVPMVMVSRDQLRWLSIDHRAGFVLSLIDGVSSLEMILDVSGMPELDALRILSELVQQRIISVR